MTQLTIEIPDKLMSELERSGCPVQEIVVKALENYIKPENSDIDITKTQTWQLCGAFEIANPEAEYIVGQDEQGKIITNYGKKVDEGIY